ncbi:hypothetical protein BM607_013080 [Shewanella sp. SACH]|nr:hypothetical protein BM607_013080 [Shewanella sp. SACH]
MRLISPQRVEADDGATVQVIDRYTVEYINKTSKWSVEVDFGIATTGILRSTLQLEAGLSSCDENTVCKCIFDALTLMGQRCEVIE